DEEPRDQVSLGEPAIHSGAFLSQRQAPTGRPDAAEPSRISPESRDYRRVTCFRVIGVERAQPAQPRGTRPHRVLVRSLVVLASVVLVLSMIANWVQTQLLDSNQLSGQTSAILKNPDVQEQLSLFAVDQLYANVDVQASIEQRLPSAAQPLAAPITALTRQLATNVAQKALA